MRLFKPAWMSDNEEKALQDVEKETNPKKLVEIIKKSPLISVCVAAVNRLSDQSVLFDIANNYGDFIFHADDWDIYEAAVNKLTDQSNIMIFAKGRGPSCVQIAAVNKLTDQSVLEDIAKNADHMTVRGSAVERLTNLSFLDNCAKNDTSLYVRCCAFVSLFAIGNLEGNEIDIIIANIIEKMISPSDFGYDEYAMEEYNRPLRKLIDGLKPDGYTKCGFELREVTNAILLLKYTSGTNVRLLDDIKEIYYKGKHVGVYDPLSQAHHRHKMTKRTPKP